MGRQLPITFCGLLIALVAMFGSSTIAFGADHADHADVTHAHASENLNNLLELKSDKAFFSAVVFLILLAVLYAFAWKPISQGLAKRENAIASQIAEAKNASEVAAAKLKEYEAKLSDAATQAQDLVTQARKDAEQVADRIKADAQLEATRSRDRALAEIESAKQAALSDLTTKSTDMAFSLARRFVGRELTSADQKKLMDDAISNLSSKN